MSIYKKITLWVIGLMVGIPLVLVLGYLSAKTATGILKNEVEYNLTVFVDDVQTDNRFQVFRGPKTFEVDMKTNEKKLCIGELTKSIFYTSCSFDGKNIDILHKLGTKELPVQFMCIIIKNNECILSFEK